MRSLRVKLLSCLMVVCLAVGLLIVGVWAVGTQTINLKGQVDFSIGDPSLYVKDIRLKNSMEDASSNGETIDNFVPGYVNTTMNLNLGKIDNTTGGLSIYIDIINTTDTTYIASTTTSISGAEITVSGTINGDAISQGDILTTDTPSGTVEIVISAPNIATLDLSQISINLDELLYIVTVNDSTLGSASFSIEGDQVTLTATLNNNTEFLGWAENSEDGYVVCDLPTYTFTDSPDVAKTYVAVFRSFDDSVIDYTYDQPATGEARATAGTNPSNSAESIIFPSTIKYNNTLYTVTQLTGFDSYSSVIVNVIIPSTIDSYYLLDSAMSMGGAQGLQTVHVRVNGVYFIEENQSLQCSVFDAFNQDSTHADTYIIDSAKVYQLFGTESATYWRPTVATVKFEQSIDTGDNEWLASEYTLSSTEVINGRTYNVYTLN